MLFYIKKLALFTRPSYDFIFIFRTLLYKNLMKSVEHVTLKKLFILQKDILKKQSNNHPKMNKCLIRFLELSINGA